MHNKKKKTHGFIPKKSKQKSIQVLHAKSNNTGLTHSFGNTKAWMDEIENFEQKQFTGQKSDLLTALSFQSFLSSHNINTIPGYELNHPIYRVVSPARDVWSVLGSIADGGRFNIGGAQMQPQLPSLNKFAALYVASTIACALDEAGKPLGKCKCYELVPKRSFFLWDLNKVIEELNHPSLADQIKATPTEAIWVYQKMPLPSQILAAYLKEKGGDGIIFPSVKVPSANNIAVFFAADRDAQDSFNVKEVQLS